MADIVDKMTDSQLEHLYRGMTDEDLQNLLCQEKCLHRRQQIRKEIRNRKKGSTAPSIAGATNINDSLLKPQVKHGQEISKSAAVLNTNTDVSNDALSKSKDNRPPDLQSVETELDKLMRELHDTSDISQRRDLRSKIKMLQSNHDTNGPANGAVTNTSMVTVASEKNEILSTVKKPVTASVSSESGVARTHPSDGTKPAPMSRSRPLSSTTSNDPDTNFLKSIDRSINRPHVKESVNLDTRVISNVNTSVNAIVEHEPRSVTKDSSLIRSETAPKGIPIDVPPTAHRNIAIPRDIKELGPSPNKSYRTKMNCLETEDVSLRFDLKDINCTNARVMWFYQDKPIEEYHKTYFTNLSVVNLDKSNASLSFSDCSTQKHQGTYKLQIRSNSVTIDAIFEVTIGQKPREKICDPSLNKSIYGLKSNNLTHVTVPVSTISRDSHEAKSGVIVTNENVHNKNLSYGASKQETVNKAPKIAVPQSSGEDLDDIINKLLGTSDSATPEAPPPSTSLVPPNQRERKLSQASHASFHSEKRARRKSSVKDLLVLWLRMSTEQYEVYRSSSILNVNITNFSGSWADGLAFCALIHHFYPDSFDYSKLNAADRAYNFNLAFQTAKDRGGIEPLLETADLVLTDSPDWKCIYTYVLSIYTQLKSHPRNVLKRSGELDN